VYPNSLKIYIIFALRYPFSVLTNLEV